MFHYRDEVARQQTALHINTCWQSWCSRLTGNAFVNEAFNNPVSIFKTNFLPLHKSSTVCYFRWQVWSVDVWPQNLAWWSLSTTARRTIILSWCNSRHNWLSNVSTSHLSKDNKTNKKDKNRTKQSKTTNRPDEGKERRCSTLPVVSFFFSYQRVGLDINQPINSL